MGDIGNHFNRAELACKCGCGQDTVDTELMDVLELVRGTFNTPVHINSANRCEKHNKEINGSPKSQHLISRAADFTVEGIHPSTIYNFLDIMFPERYGIGNYSSFTHLDTRAKKARW